MVLSLLLAHTNSFSPAILTLDDPLVQPCDSNYIESYPLALLCQHMFAFITTNLDKINLNESLKQPVCNQSIKAIYKELNNHVTRKKGSTNITCSIIKKIYSNGMVHRMQVKSSRKDYKVEGTPLCWRKSIS